MSRVLTALIFPAAVLVLWQFAAHAGLISPVFFPAPSRVITALYQSAESGKLWTALAATSLRMVLGWGLACLLGIAAGALIGSSRQVREYLGPLLEFLRPFPTSAIVPVAILIFGFSNAMTIWVIAFGSVWPVLLGTLHGVSSIDGRLKEVAATLEMRPLDYAFKMALPSALPDIFTGVRTSLFIALILAVVVEMQAGQSGLGQNILMAQRMFRSSDLYAGTIVIGLFGYLVSVALDAIERRIFLWKFTR